jgi:[ribosomal protein S18]-alanine N-acetyltransferase
MSVLSRFLGRTGGEPALVIEPMRKRDLPAIMAIEQVSYPKPWTPGVFQSEIEMSRRGERFYIVARRDQRLAGYAGAMFVVGDAHVTNIAAAPEARRSGVATRLLAEVAWEAIRRECQALTLEVRSTNDGAQALYRQFGFAPVGVRKKYYENTEDAIVMWCHEIADEPYRDRLAELCPEAAR